MVTKLTQEIEAEDKVAYENLAKRLLREAIQEVSDCEKGLKKAKKDLEELEVKITLAEKLPDNHVICYHTGNEIIVKGLSYKGELNND